MSTNPVEDVLSQKVKRTVKVIDEERFFELENMLPPLTYNSISTVVREPLFYANNGKAVYTSIFQLASTQHGETLISVDLTLAEWEALSSLSTLDGWVSVAQTLPSLEDIKSDGT